MFPNCPLSTKSDLINGPVAVFSARELSHDDAPTARSIPARGNAPGTCPSTSPALQGRRNPPPLQDALIDSETRGVALGFLAAALSAPESKWCTSKFTSLAGCPFILNSEVGGWFHRDSLTDFGSGCGFRMQ